MNIGIVTTWFERGAAYVSKQYKLILEKEHNVFIYARGGEKYAIGDPLWDIENVTWGKIAHIPLAMAMDLKDFEKWIKKHELDVVFFNEQQWWEPILLCNKLGIRTGAYIDYYTEDTIPLFGCYDFLICNTLRHYNVFKWHPQAYYVKWGTEIEVFKPNKYANVEDGVVTFFHSCGYSPDRKGTDSLIKAFSKVKGPAKLVIHSQTSVKEMCCETIEVIRDLVDSGKLVLIEKTVAAPGLYHLGDIYVYPTRLEGIGLTIAEALACGLPVITCDNPPMNEFIDESSGKLAKISLLYARNDGYYWPQCSVDVDSLYECMQEYVDNKFDIETAKKKARDYAEKNLDWMRNGQALLNIFSKAELVQISQKQTYLERARSFEEKRLTLQQKFPVIFNCYYSLRKVIMGCKNARK